jgi:enoyl-CoA hydratase/carnithine racemase
LLERLRPSLCRGVGYVHSERFDSPEKEPSARSRPDSAKFAAIARIEHEDAARVVVITETGRAFSADGDLKTFRSGL